VRGRRLGKKNRESTERKKTSRSRTCRGPQRRRPGKVRVVLGRDRRELRPGGAHAPLGLAERGRGSEERAGVLFFAGVIFFVAFVVVVVAAGAE